MSISLKKHLDRIRKLGHKTQRKNGHYKRMADTSAKLRKTRKLYKSLKMNGK